MLKHAFVLTLSLFSLLEGNQIDVALSKQPWSQFGPLSQNYATGRKEKPDAAYAILKNYVSYNAAILDLGSGTGISTRQLHRVGFKNVIGVDRDPLMIKEAWAANCPNCLIKYICADVSNELPFPDEQFDVVSATSAFHWFANPTSIKEVARVLKPQGYYLIVGSQNQNRIDPVKATIRRFFEEFGVPPKPKKEDSLPVEALTKQGFKVIVDTTISYDRYYTKKEYVASIQSKSYWNFVKEPQRHRILKKIDHYLDSIVDGQGRIKQEGQVFVVLVQKIGKPLPPK